jgi:hypothetical protein
MPFRHVDTSGFGPEDLKILHDVFDLSWQRLLNDGLESDDNQVEEARRRLGKLHYGERRARATGCQNAV